MGVSEKGGRRIAGTSKGKICLVEFFSCGQLPRGLLPCAWFWTLCSQTGLGDPVGVPRELRSNVME